MLSWACNLPLLPAYDVVVCGGGPAGIPATLAARRAGRSVLLIEQTGQLGGIATSGGVSTYLGYRIGRARWVGGIFEEIVQDLLASGDAVDSAIDYPTKYQPHGWYPGLAWGIPFEPPAAAMLFDRKIREAGVDVLLYTHVVDTLVQNDRINHVIIHNKSGLQAVPTTTVIDATGDADVAARSGCAVITGREDDGLMTPASVTFCMERVDRDALSAYIHEHDEPRFRTLIARLRAEGKWPFPYEIMIAFQLVGDDIFMINTTRICGVDGTSGDSLTEGTMNGREEVRLLVALLREYFPGFTQARLRWVAPVIGIRETRRIVGRFRLTVDDLLAQTDYPDTIGFSAYGWDLPDPKKPSYQPMNEQQPMTRPYTPIPYRIMVPQPITNLICPGRAVSVDRDVLGPLRVMAPVFAMGEAAGLAADEVIAHSSAFADIDTTHLRNRLRAQGAIVDADQVSESKETK